MNNIIQIVTAAAGWRVVETYLGAQGDLATLPDEHLYGVRPIACFALTEDSDGLRTIEPITTDDWPAYLWPAYLWPAQEAGRIDLLGPGDTLSHEHRSEAVEQIEAFREKQAKARAAATGPA